MIPYARLAPGEGFQPDRALGYYAQRLVTWPLARRGVSKAIAAELRRRHGDGQGWVGGEEAGAALGDLRRDGLAMLPPLLSRDAAEEMAAYFQRSAVVGPDGRAASLEDLPAGAAAAAYSLETVLACPDLPALLSAPHVLRIAADYLGCKPTLSSVGVRWSLPSAEQGARFHEYHRDMDDWRFLKLFVYLSDVDPESGPHAYVRGSHATGFGWKAKAYTQAEIEGQFGAGRVATVLGGPGTTFMADTLGVHRGGQPRARPRLMLQVQYSLLPIFAFDYRPIEVAAIPGDAYCNRLLFRRQAAASDRTAEPAQLLPMKAPT